jgi:hypothetical protein
MDHSQTPDIKVACHFTILLYPFRHRLLERQRSSGLKRLRDRWRPWFSRLDRDSFEHALDDTYFFLPPVRKLLFPETALLPAGSASQQVGQAMQLAGRTADALAQELYACGTLPDGVLRLTYAPEPLAALQPLRLVFEPTNDRGRRVEQFSAPTRLCWVDVALFPQSVGFLVLKVQLDEDKVSISRLNDWLYYLRQVHPPPIDWQLPTWRQKQGTAPLVYTGRDLVDFLLQGLAEGAEEIHPTFDAFLNSVPDSQVLGCYSTIEEGQVYGQVFRQYTYACLDEPVSAAHPHAAATTGKSSPASLKETSSLFASPAAQALYELVTCTDTTNDDYAPHPRGLAKVRDSGHIALWAN